ncbi:MAG: zinc-dependent alcohol dehydrogenase family protein [Phenylobacterium sp.]|uniref:zinc-dependent alcohol dehydrogenase family protein n=1 Tax=Phenylobacterium sp. TaxID=1871053 RepID=UPI00273651D1|nr:zinc-dependent alcohol dehydrogenase family protein [Phenylobacterium sp.]MDP3176074.1 zinc-dependent alcohol dehydrogenase family protein [Phenylobacterium sp.]
MARIVRFHELGGPDVLRVEEVDPGAPGADEVLLNIEAIGLNRGEAAFRGGHYIFKPTLPSYIGGEATGRVAQLGSNVQGLKVGDAVVFMPISPPGERSIYGEQAVVPALSLVKAPEGLDAIQNGSVWVAFLTAWGGLAKAGLAKGQTVIIPAASSAVGLAAVQIAHDIGATVIATTRRSGKSDAILAAGADHVVATEEQDIKAEVARITGGKGVELIFDPVAGPFAETLFECLADDGTLMIYGGMANQPHIFPRQLSIRKNLTMRGYNFFELLRDRPRLDAAMGEIAARIRDGRFKMPVAKIFPLDQVAEAHRFLESNTHIGKIVMQP